MEGGGKGGGLGGGSSRARLGNIQDRDDAEVVIRADDAVDGHQDGEPDQVRIHGSFEDIELAEEPSRDGQAEEREQEESKGCRCHWLAMAEAGIVVERKVLFACAPELRKDRGGALFYSGIS